MSFLREMGLTAALLAATGGAAIATWSYISARRRKEAGHGSDTEQKHGADELKTEQPSMVTPSSSGTQGAHIGFSETQRGEQAAETGTLVLPVHTHRAGGEHSIQEEDTSQPETSAEEEDNVCTVHVHHRAQPQTSVSAYAGQVEQRLQPERSAVQVEGEGSASAVQVDQRSQPETSVSACVGKVDQRSQPETSVSACVGKVDQRAQPETSVSACVGKVDQRAQPETSVSAYAEQVDQRLQPERSAVQVEGEGSASAVLDQRSAVQVEGEGSASAVLDQRSAVQVEEGNASAAQVDERSAVQVEESSACAEQVDQRLQPERSAVQVEESSACAVQGDQRSQPDRSTVQVEEGSACAVLVDQRSQPDRSAVQEEGGSACAVQVDQRSQPDTSAVQEEGSTSAVQVDQRSQPERSTVQVAAETKGSAYTVQEDIRAEKHPLPVESPISKELSDSNICTEIQPQVKASLRQHVVVLGLDGSGKTSVLNSIAANKGKFMTTPTAGVNALCVSNGTSKMEFLEIGGSEHLRPYWKMYLSKAFAVIFVVDSADHGRLPLAKRHLHQLIQQDSIIPLIVLANKQDLKNAYHITEVHEALGLSDICENRKLFLIGTYATKEESEVSSGILDTKEFLAQLHAENSTIRS